MPRRKVLFVSGEFYHLYNRGVNRQPIFFSDENYVHFLTRLRKYVLPSVDVIAYCLMPNHFHLLVRLANADLSRCMSAAAMSYAKGLNVQRGRVGSLFQGPFQAIHIDEPEYLLHLSRYIHRNPVAARLVRCPEEWRYSSYREFIGWRSGTLPKPQVILAEFGSREAYREFVDSASALPTPCRRYLFSER